MRALAATLLMVIGALGAVPVSAGTLVVPGDDEPLVIQEDSDALTEDLGLMAEANDWTLEEAEAQFVAAAEVGAVAQAVAATHPAAFVGSALSDRPGGAPTLFVKGPASSLVHALVERSAVPILIADQQPYSFDELEAQNLAVHKAVVGLGYDDVASSFNILERGAISVAVTAVPGLPNRPEDIAEAIPEALRSRVTITLVEEDVAVDFSVFGGMSAQDDGVQECTTGWSVADNGFGTTGVTTAGHCTGINQAFHPGHGAHPINFIREHRGQWGDVEFHTSGFAEPATFYSDADTIRNVLAVAAIASISVNESICAYGRKSNVRDCSLQVQDVSQACTNSGVFNDRLVMMDGVGVMTQGDSGGGWSFGTTAYGSDKGVCAPNFLNKSVFSAAAYYPNAVGVTVLTQ